MVDSAGGGFSKVGAAGWAFDADNCGTALEIHIYMDGKLLGTTVANLYRPDVNNVYKCGDYHGYAFETEVDASMSGEHTLDVYAINVGGGAPSVLLASKKVTISQDKEAPVISDIQVMDITANSYVVSCRVTDNTEVNRVQFPTWSAVNGQDDIVPNWPVNAAASGTRNGDIYTYTVNIADHNNDRGIYATHIYAYDKYGNCSSARVDTIEILELPEIEYDLGDDFFAIVENAYVHTALKKIHNGQTQDAIFSDKDGTREQMWHFVRNSRNEPYTIYCEGNEALVLDVSGGIDADKRNVTTWVENGSDAQKWYIRKKDGLYYLQPCCSSTRVLDVPGGQSGERNAQIYSYNTDHGTGMNIIKVDPVKVELSEEKLLTTGNYNGHRYEVFDQGMNWTDAKRSCILRGGHLVTITDAGEQEFIEKLLTNGTMNQYWLGFKKYGRNFAWITGENSEYEHWDAGEPTNGGADISYPGREYCAHIYNKTNPANGGKRFYWNDINNSNTLVNELDFFNTDVVGVICEYDYIENYTLTI
ncbi:MAG: RICIN domain-containing protein [Lachnospiraceae bacterium]